jgi:hypothetical protein
MDSMGKMNSKSMGMKGVHGGWYGESEISRMMAAA